MFLDKFLCTDVKLQEEVPLEGILVLKDFSLIIKHSIKQAHMSCGPDKSFVL